MDFLDRHAYDLGAACGRAVAPLFRRRLRLAADNVLQSGCAADPAGARRIARTSFGHLIGHICEALAVPHAVTRENYRDHLDFSEADPETVRLLLDETDRPILLVSSHHGVWEAATNVLSFARPMIAVARTMNNGLAARWMKKHHFRGPVTIVDKNRGFTADVIRQWRRENAAMTILMDQRASPRNDRAMKCDFLGRPAWTFTTAARLAVRHGAPIVVGSFVRVAPFRYRLVGGPPLAYASDVKLAKAVYELNQRLADAIRRYPEQYLWAHNRWR